MWKKIVQVLIKLWSYSKNSWEGDDGKLSYRRVAQYVFLYCLIKVAMWPPKNQWEYGVFITFAILYLIQSLLMTAQQVITLLRYSLPIFRKSSFDGGGDYFNRGFEQPPLNSDNNQNDQEQTPT